jgi:hypothetical protein
VCVCVCVCVCVWASSDMRGPTMFDFIKFNYYGHDVEYFLKVVP